MRVAVITGANRGIGNHWVVRLLEKGWIVYAGYKESLGGLEVIENENLIALQLDVTSSESIEKFVGSVEGLSLIHI